MPPSSPTLPLPLPLPLPPARRALRAVRRHVRAAPATFVYLGVLTVTTIVLSAVDHRTAARVVLHASTNVHHLARAPLRVLVASAFWLAQGVGELAYWGLLFVAVVAPVERRLGTLRAATAFVSGHVGATLLSQAVTAIAISTGVLSARWANVPDVGASYGFAAVAGVLFGLVPSRWRAAYAAGLLAWLIAVSHVGAADYTTFGHVTAVLIGLAVGPTLRRRRVEVR